jgi:probable F420-dependent oxidoreductase
MKFTAELMLEGRVPTSALSTERLAALATAAEDAGFDAIALNDHPAPPASWVDAGGHDSFEPFSALAFFAGVTQSIHLMTHLVVLPYRNPFLMAKSIATVDILSGGRLIIAAGTGYLEHEFEALGVHFAQRNLLFDEYMEVMERALTGNPVTGAYTGYSAIDQISLPRPLQQPHPPVWIGGNSAIARERVVKYGQGWSPLQFGSGMATKARTARIETDDELATAITDLKHELERHGRDPGAVAIQISNPDSRRIGRNDYRPTEHLQRLTTFARLGVTQYVIRLQVDTSDGAEQALQRYGADVITAMPNP